MSVSLTDGAGNHDGSRPAGSPIGRLRKRPEFQRVAKGRRYHVSGFTVQCAPRDDTETTARFGLTITRKVGTAVERNRIRRRLRSALVTSSDIPSKPGHDYVLVARREALYLPFPELIRDLQTAISAVGSKSRRKTPDRKPD
ncbi:MAG: ribonuclease P protein component [Rhizobiales bacterium]|nr:ribonuclease P protein component [Hyphomicrobiales bacterium]